VSTPAYVAIYIDCYTLLICFLHATYCMADTRIHMYIPLCFVSDCTR